MERVISARHGDDHYFNGRFRQVRILCALAKLNSKLRLKGLARADRYGRAGSASPERLIWRLRRCPTSPGAALSLRERARDASVKVFATGTLQSGTDLASFAHNPGFAIPPICRRCCPAPRH